jgi:hypothetical protein
MSHDERQSGDEAPAIFVGFPRQEWGHRRPRHWLVVVLCAGAGLLSLAAGLMIEHRVRTLTVCLVPDGSAASGLRASHLADDAQLRDFTTQLVVRAESWSPATVDAAQARTLACLHPSARLACTQAFQQHRLEIAAIPTAQMAEPISCSITRRDAASATVAVAYRLRRFLVTHDPPAWSFVRTETWVMTAEVLGIVPDDEHALGMVALLPQRQIADEYLHDGGTRFWGDSHE